MLHKLAHDLAGLWLTNVSQDLSRYVVFATGVWFTLWVLLRTVLKGRKIRSDTPPARQLASEFAFSVRSIATFSTIGVGITLLSDRGAYPLASLAQAWGPAWFGVSVLAMIVAQDAYLYWTHRIMHHPRLFRQTHRRHHRSNNPSPFTAYSFDIPEAVVVASFVMWWPMVFPTTWHAVAVVTVHQIARNCLLHGGYELMPMRRDGRPWLDFMTTTTHHDLHHGQAGCNYGAWFTWWDRWMGTEHPEYLAAYARVASRPYIAAAGQAA